MFGGKTRIKSRESHLKKFKRGFHNLLVYLSSSLLFIYLHYYCPRHFIIQTRKLEQKFNQLCNMLSEENARAITH